ncbi:hypothetical protein CLV98_109135 [Dyadobacter jejuensis]|uniref:Uncharacterized protein n=1 Tax=Dyadobacter jejuensis TaxID=1082580 RepID=A0A316AGU4_9BACT|nr:hypothetical protein [Dyadobacter jejuensis]PWJ57026.1 hypothetical protein CLV98_109135 [Dyadobacter jejuensis]
MAIQKFNDRVRVRVKNDPEVWVILAHEKIPKGASVKITGKVKCRNEETGDIKFFNEKNCELA